MKKSESKIIDIVKNAMKENAKKQTLETLGDRSKYVGSSDVCQCALKSVLNKLEPVEHELETLVRFKRGHMTETIIAEAYRDIASRFPGYTLVEQQLVEHPDFPYMQAHIDFIVYNKDMSIAKIIECKSASSIPDKPKDTWVRQVNWQLHLAKLNLFKDVPTKITASVLAFDLNTGEVAEYGDFEEDEFQFEISVAKAQQIMTAVQENNPALTDAEATPLCSCCDYKAKCPYYTENVEHLEDKDTIALIESFYSVKNQMDSLKGRCDAIKAELIEMFGQDKVKATTGEYVLKIKTINGRMTTAFDTDALTAYLNENYPDVEIDTEKFVKKSFGKPYSVLEVATV